LEEVSGFRKGCQGSVGKKKAPPVGRRRKTRCKKESSMSVEMLNEK